MPNSTWLDLTCGNTTLSSQECNWTGLENPTLVHNLHPIVWCPIPWHTEQ